MNMPVEDLPNYTLTYHPADNFGLESNSLNFLLTFLKNSQKKRSHLSSLSDSNLADLSIQAEPVIFSCQANLRANRHFDSLNNLLADAPHSNSNDETESQEFEKDLSGKIFGTESGPNFSVRVEKLDEVNRKYRMLELFDKRICGNLGEVDCFVYVQNNGTGKLTFGFSLDPERDNDLGDISLAEVAEINSRITELSKKLDFALGNSLYKDLPPFCVGLSKNSISPSPPEIQ